MSFIKPDNCYALIDCNNFFVSCERVFAPSLINKPVIVLSSNDGCIIARSEEVKAFGIPMGAPLFKYKEIILAHNISLFSSNFTLYGDMSRRVVKTLSSFGLPVERYSIDESFLLCPLDFDFHQIREWIIQWTGIPTAIGIAPTKTLAKLANKYAKRKKQSMHFLLENANIDELLRETPVEDIWGIGKRIAQKLKEYAITTAYQLKNTDDLFIKKKFSITTLKTVLELRGVQCLSHDEHPDPKQSLTYSRSFGKPVYCLAELKEAIATFTARLAEKLRKQKSLARLIVVFTSHDSQQILMPIHTNDTRSLLQYTMQMTETLFSEDLIYKKAGVIACDLCSESTKQADFFDAVEDPVLMKLIDSINTRFGNGSLYFAAEGIEKKWKSKQEKISQKYTTSWDELLRIVL